MLGHALVMNASFTLDQNSARGPWQINRRRKRGAAACASSLPLWFAAPLWHARRNKRCRPAALNYSSGYLDERLRYEQTVVGYNTSADIFDGIGAGPFSMAAGVEWRQDVGHDDEVNCPANDAACQARIQDFAWRAGFRLSF